MLGFTSIRPVILYTTLRTNADQLCFMVLHLWLEYSLTYEYTLLHILLLVMMDLWNFYGILTTTFLLRATAFNEIMRIMDVCCIGIQLE